MGLLFLFIAEQTEREKGGFKKMIKSLESNRQNSK